MQKGIVDMGGKLLETYFLRTLKRKYMDILLSKLDEAIDDMENGRVQTIDEAWEEIDAI